MSKKISKPVKIIISLVAVLLVIGIGVGAGFGIINMTPKQGEIEVKTVGDGKSLKVGILSDTQLPMESEDSGGAAAYKDNLKATLELMKEQQVQVILHAGDICENATNYAYQTYLNVFHEVYPDENSRPITQYIMGNHDFWGKNTHKYPGYKKQLFKKNMGVSPWTHYVINGFHFIAASPDTGNSIMGYEWGTPSWIEKQVELAEKDAKEKGMPIFVMTHSNPQNTVYGSDEWGDYQVGSVLKNHPQVVSISGHSHYSILDERSIDQDNFTAFSTQSVAYVEMERDKFDAFQGGLRSCPPNDTQSPMCLIMNVTQEKTEIERWNVYKKAEEKADSRWTLGYPLEKGNFTYTDASRSITRPAPSFPENASIRYNSSIANYQDKEPKTLPGITFTAARHPDLIHSYYLELENRQTKKTYQYKVFSDFYAGAKDMKTTVDIALDPTLPTGSYHIKVYGMESFGKYTPKPLELDIDWTQVKAPDAEK